MLVQSDQVKWVNYILYWLCNLGFTTSKISNHCKTATNKSTVNKQQAINITIYTVVQKLDLCNTVTNHIHQYHRLRGSASPVLTATGFVNGKGQFSTPQQNRHPSTDHQNICHRWLRRRPLRLCQIRCISVHGGLLGTWVKYNQHYFYLCPFLKKLIYRSDMYERMNEWKCEDFKCVWKPTESRLCLTLCKQIKPLSEVKPEMVR